MFSPPPKAARSQDSSDIKSKLLQNILDNYINLPWYKKLIAGIGKEGEDRAQGYYDELKKENFTSEAVFVNQRLRELAYNDGQGRLETSKNLRVVIAESLCAHYQISAADLDRKTQDSMGIFPAANIFVSYDLRKVDVACDLIRAARQNANQLNQPTTGKAPPSLEIAPFRPA